ncbi:hypothetical protein AB0395_18935 [Streptosporangium sp. NPDC051023]|uniref:hypothetical protein n=1 Tax=Streptosporangium sp. NPDC051023 TaxID=3155410 RepID=UPI00344BB82A
MSIDSVSELLPFADADADARLGGALSFCFQGSYENVLLFDGDLVLDVLDGDFLESVVAADGQEADIIAVAGDLTVTGQIALYEYTPGLYVGGFTRAETLEGGDCEIYVKDGAFTHLVYGYYNDGTLETGEIETPWVINSDHDLRVNAPGAYRVDNMDYVDDADFSRENIAASFVAEVVDSEYDSIIVHKFLDRLRAGLPVLLPGARSLHGKPRQGLPHP